MQGRPIPEIAPVDERTIDRASQLLREGQIVAVPTETVYGLAARADDPAAVANIYCAKGRPDFNPLIVHIYDLEMAKQIAQFDDRALALAEHFWPGPLTMVLPLKPSASIAPAVTAGLPTIALRMPSHPAMRRLLAATNLPLAAPSANKSGGVSPTTAEHVAQSLTGRVPLVLDGGHSERGLESTIVALRDDGTWQMLRPGPITAKAIGEICGTSATIASKGIEAPGQLESHYAPGKPVRLSASTFGPDEFVIGFGAVMGDCTLSAVGDLSEAAARLYSCLHMAAASDKPRVAVAPVPEEGIGVAINDRLRRAAA